MWGTLGVSDRATSIRVVCQQPPKCHQRANAAFRQRRQIDVAALTTLQCLEVVGILGPPFEPLQMQIYLYRACSSSLVFFCTWMYG